MRPPAGPLVAAAMACAAAQAASPVSNDCRAALNALHSEESRVIAARQGGGAPPSLDELNGLRAAAARACLGGTGQAPPPTARRLPPAEAARPSPSAAWRPAAMPARPVMPAAPVPPPPTMERPVLITHCDPSGCWATDGIWRPRVGGTLGGPRGLCTTQGTLVSCP
jgi:hypothetical protein